MSTASRLAALEKATADHAEAPLEVDLSALTDAELARLKSFRQRLDARRAAGEPADATAFTTEELKELEPINAKILVRPLEANQ